MHSTRQLRREGPPPGDPITIDSLGRTIGTRAELPDEEWGGWSRTSRPKVLGKWVMTLFGDRAGGAYPAG